MNADQLQEKMVLPMAHSPSSRVRVVCHRPLHSVFYQFSVVCFSLTLVSDILYWRTMHLMWHNFSSWLLFAGLMVGAVAVIVAIVEGLVPRLRPTAPTLPRAVGSGIVLLLGILNSLVHAGDGWTGIVPWGLTLSAVMVVLMIAVDIYERVYAARRYTEIHHV